jgi:hypothetical protein
MDLALHLRAVLDELAAAAARAATVPVQRELAEARRHVVNAMQLLERPAYLARRR